MAKEIEKKTSTKEKQKTAAIISDAIIAALEARKMGEYTFSVGADENGKPILMTVKHKRMPAGFYIRSQKCPTLITEVFAAQFLGEDPEAFEKRWNAVTDKIQKESNPIEEFLKVQDFQADVLVETAIEPRFTKDIESDYENGVLSVTLLTDEELRAYAMYQLNGAPNAPVAVSGGGEVSVGELANFPANE